jgi:hypothetical protein
MQSVDTPVSAPVTLHELYGPARCVSCQQKARRCHVEQGAECCLQCAPDEPCTFSRTVLRTGSAKTFSWEELIGRSAPLPVNQLQQVGQALPEARKSPQRQHHSGTFTYHSSPFSSWSVPDQQGLIGELSRTASHPSAEPRPIVSPEFRTTTSPVHEDTQGHGRASLQTIESSAQSSVFLMCPEKGCDHGSRTQSEFKYASLDTAEKDQY